MELFDIETLCQNEEIELKGDDGQPFCCNQRMNVKSGVIGPDYAKCLICGKTIGNLMSPHINGGIIVSSEWIKEHYPKIWGRIN